MQLNDKQTSPAILVLQDGSIFEGTAIGALGETVGELVFNTSMMGYQEILTDPSYAQQIVTLTYPHIGNTGTNEEDEEFERLWAKGLVIRDLTLLTSSFRNQKSLSDYLRANNIVGICDIDTRRLTRLLRDKGAQSACIIAGDIDRERALLLAKEFPGIKGADLAKVVTTKNNYAWSEGSWQLNKGFTKPAPEKKRFKVVAYDFGVKRNILRILADKGCDLTVVPAHTSAEAVLAMNPDGVFLSNGPGDPEPCVYAIEAVRSIMDRGLPIFGICLGYQLLALASGAKTVKMKFGHHGANHPVQELASGRVMITSQNHGFSVDESSLPDTLEVTHKSLFDGSLQGIQHKHRPAFGFQGHPEASPGPHDVAGLFSQFVESMQAHSQ